MPYKPELEPSISQLLGEDRSSQHWVISEVLDYAAVHPLKTVTGALALTVAVYFGARALHLLFEP